MDGDRHGAVGLMAGAPFRRDERAREFTPQQRRSSFGLLGDRYSSNAAHGEISASGEY
jgi:hypothetical protein